MPGPPCDDRGAAAPRRPRRRRRPRRSTSAARRTSGRVSAACRDSSWQSSALIVVAGGHPVGVRVAPRAPRPLGPSRAMAPTLPRGPSAAGRLGARRCASSARRPRGVGARASISSSTAATGARNRERDVVPPRDDQVHTSSLSGRVIATYSRRRSSSSCSGVVALDDRQRALLEPGDRDVVPLEALRAVDRGQRDGVGALGPLGSARPVALEVRGRGLLRAEAQHGHARALAGGGERVERGVGPRQHGGLAPGARGAVHRAAPRRDPGGLGLVVGEGHERAARSPPSVAATRSSGPRSSAAVAARTIASVERWFRGSVSTRVGGHRRDEVVEQGAGPRRSSRRWTGSGRRRRRGRGRRPPSRRAGRTARGSCPGARRRTGAACAIGTRRARRRRARRAGSRPPAGRRSRGRRVAGTPGRRCRAPLPSAAATSGAVGAPRARPRRSSTRRAAATSPRTTSASRRAIAGAGRVSPSSAATSMKSRCRSAAITGAGWPRSSAWTSRTSSSAARWNVPARTPSTPERCSLVRSSPAALRVKVATSTWRGSSDSSCTRRTTRWVSTRVLPAPAPARTTMRRSCASIASSCSGVNPCTSTSSAPATLGTYRGDVTGVAGRSQGPLVASARCCRRSSTVPSSARRAARDRRGRCSCTGGAAATRTSTPSPRASRRRASARSPSTSRASGPPPRRPRRRGRAATPRRSRPSLESIAASSGPPVLVGHSFGGRVAVCVAAPAARVGRGPRSQRRPARALGDAVVAPVAALPGDPRWRRGPDSCPTRALESARRRHGSADYRAASGVMRDVLVVTVAESYEDELAALRCPVALVWGDGRHDGAARASPRPPASSPPGRASRSSTGSGTSSRPRRQRRSPRSCAPCSGGGR